MIVCGCKTRQRVDPELARNNPPTPPVQNVTNSINGSESPKIIVTPGSGSSGKVATYNEAGQFVVLDFPVGQTPQAERRMFVYRNGLKVGEVKISEWRRENLVTADLVAGEAQRGDEVRDK